MAQLLTAGDSTAYSCTSRLQPAHSRTVPSCSDFAVTLLPSWAWGRAGTWAADSGSLTAAAAGLRSVTLYTTSPTDPTLAVHPLLSTPAASQQITFPLGKGGGLSTKGRSPNFPTIVAHMSAAHDAGAVQESNPVTALHLNAAPFCCVSWGTQCTRSTRSTPTWPRWPTRSSRRSCGACFTCRCATAAAICQPSCEMQADGSPHPASSQLLR